MAQKSEEISIEVIKERSVHLETVISLSDAHKATLGLLPRAAFSEHAAKGNIIVALNGQGNCIGYALFTKVKKDNAIRLTHLCVDPSWRGHGIAKKLVDYLSENNPKFYGIRLKCRRDYNLDGMWQKLGFLPTHEKSAKKKGKLLTSWWRDHGHPTLFSNQAKEKLESHICATIDSDIFLELDDQKSADLTSESDALKADWLSDNLELCITDEIFNIINQISDQKTRERKRRFANNSQQFTKLPYDRQIFAEKIAKLNKFLADKNIQIADSLIQQVAMAIASESPIFITKNQHILELSDDLYEQFRLLVNSPINIITNFDEIASKADYQPVRLAGTNLQIKPQKLPIPDNIINYFVNSPNSENENDFKNNLRQMISKSDKFQCFIVTIDDDDPVALFVYNRTKNYELEIPIFRLRSHSLAGILAKHLIVHSVSIAADEKRTITKISDHYLDELVFQAIQADGSFRRNQKQYMKLSIATAETANQIAESLVNLAQLEPAYEIFQPIAETLKTAQLDQDITTISILEHHLWPAKIIDADLPNIIITIQPQWAKDLFDQELASQWLFGAQADLMLRPELIYYRSNRKDAGLQPGFIGRILWYVSEDSSFTLGTKEIKACSRLDEVIIDKPENLYRQFRHLGVYNLNDLVKITNGNLAQDIMAIRFSDTRLFKKRITLKELQKILGRSIIPQGPVKLTKEEFAVIYQMATS